MARQRQRGLLAYIASSSSESKHGKKKKWRRENIMAAWRKAAHRHQLAVNSVRKAAAYNIKIAYGARRGKAKYQQ